MLIWCFRFHLCFLPIDLQFSSAQTGKYIPDIGFSIIFRLRFLQIIHNDYDICVASDMYLVGTFY